MFGRVFEDRLAIGTGSVVSSSGGSGDAGFVDVMRGQDMDRDRVYARSTSSSPRAGRFVPA